jgi:DNA invertase Pin-like site-specific DNA recombinase
MKLVGYTRVSTTKQVEGTSLKTQKEQLELFCKVHGHELVHLFTDEGLSGKRGSVRPQYSNMVKRLADDPEVEGIIVASLSRLGRSLADIIALTTQMSDAGRTFISVKENYDLSTKEGRMSFGVMAVVNQYERELIAERMEEGRAYAEVHGTKSGKPCHRPRKEINWSLVESMRKEGLSWGTVAKAISANPDTPISKTTLIDRARERGMKI